MEPRMVVSLVLKGSQHSMEYLYSWIDNDNSTEEWEEWEEWKGCKRKEGKWRKEGKDQSEVS
jgi:hypothetical protein